jgi:hypothetical protein
MINLIDEAGVLSADEFTRLKNFIVDECYCTSEETSWLLSVKVRNDGASGYKGYWTASFEREGADVKNLQAVIVLNATYLLTVEQMEKTLAHEFGHHWTLGYLMTKHETPSWFGHRAPFLYYRIRGLDPDSFAPDYSKGWINCDKEVMAEDYKYRFSPYKGEHRMAHMVGNPSSEVKIYFENLGSPVWL